MTTTVTAATSTFLAAAERVLAEAGEPLATVAITERALAAGVLATAGRTPDATMGAQLYTSIQRHGEASPFVQTAPGTFALRRWVAEGRIALPVESGSDDVRIVFYPAYDEVRALLPVLTGMSRASVGALRAAIWEHTGTFAENVDWTEPDRWIPERLAGEHRDAALRIWQGTQHAVNPRHMAGHWYLASGYGLLADGADGRLAVTPRGQAFIVGDAGVVRELDAREGLLPLLAMVAEQGPAASGALLEPWTRFVSGVSRIRAASTARSFLYWRLRNLVGRGFVERAGTRYGVTPAGLAYLKAAGTPAPDRPGPPPEPAPDAMQRLRELAVEQRAAVRQALRDRLAAMDPYAFEQLVGRLLEEMGYSEVEVTARSGDKGVDVIARIVLGITEVREVVQVKRQRQNVQRPVLDQLRGSLHRFGAVRGTIITLGGVAKGARDAAFEGGAAPITLIDGEKLLDLLVQHGVGVRRRPLELLELDADALTGPGEGAAGSDV